MAKEIPNYMPNVIDLVVGPFHNSISNSNNLVGDRFPIHNHGHDIGSVDMVGSIAVLEVRCLGGR